MRSLIEFHYRFTDQFSVVRLHLRKMRCNTIQLYKSIGSPINRSMQLLKLIRNLAGQNHRPDFRLVHISSDTRSIQTLSHLYISYIFLQSIHDKYQCNPTSRESNSRSVIRYTAKIDAKLTYRYTHQSDIGEVGPLFPPRFGRLSLHWHETDRQNIRAIPVWSDNNNAPKTHGQKLARGYRGEDLGVIARRACWYRGRGSGRRCVADKWTRFRGQGCRFLRTREH